MCFAMSTPPSFALATLALDRFFAVELGKLPQRFLLLGIQCGRYHNLDFDEEVAATPSL